MAKIGKLGRTSRAIGKKVGGGEQDIYKKSLARWLSEQIEKDKAAKHRHYLAFGGKVEKAEDYLTALEDGLDLAEGEERETYHATVEAIQEKSQRQGLGEEGTWRTGYQVGYRVGGE